jgi:hypothetical protein
VKGTAARITNTAIADPSNTKLYKLFIGFSYAVKEKFYNIELQICKSNLVHLVQFAFLKRKLMGPYLTQEVIIERIIGEVGQICQNLLLCFYKT